MAKLKRECGRKPRYRDRIADRPDAHRLRRHHSKPVLAAVHEALCSEKDDMRQRVPYESVIKDDDYKPEGFESS